MSSMDMNSYMIATGIVAVCVALGVLISYSNRHYDRSKDVTRSGWGRLVFGGFLAAVLYLAARSLEVPAKQLLVVSGGAAALIGSWVIAGFLNKK